MVHGIKESKFLKILRKTKQLLIGLCFLRMTVEEKPTKCREKGVIQAVVFSHLGFYSLFDVFYVELH